MTSPFRDEKEAALARVEQLERENAELRAKLGAPAPVAQRGAAQPDPWRIFPYVLLGAFVAALLVFAWGYLRHRAAMQPSPVLMPPPAAPAAATAEAPTGQWAALTASSRTLRAAAAFGNTAYFVGDRGAVVRFGDASTPDEQVLDARGTTLLGVGGAPGHVFAVGTNGAAYEQTGKPDGRAWLADATSAMTDLRAVAWADGEAWAVGAHGTLVHRRDGERWLRFADGTIDADLYGVAFGNGAMYAVGSHGAIWRHQHETWVQEPSGVEAELYAIAAHDGALYAVGAGGTILRRARDGWVREASGTMRDLRAVASDGVRVYAVGDDGVILSSGARGTWVAEASHSNAPLTAVAAAQTDGTRYVYAAGEGALLRRTPM